MTFANAGYWGPEPILDTSGQPVDNASLYVYTDSARTQLASLYTDTTKGTAASNPVASDPLGNYTVWAAPGLYYTKAVWANQTVNSTILVQPYPSDIQPSGAYVGTGSIWTGTGGFSSTAFAQLEHNNASGGYVLHMPTGAAASGGELIGIGLGDNGATNTSGILISQKDTGTGGISSGTGIALVNQPGTTGYALHGTDARVGALTDNAFVLLENDGATTSATTGPLLELLGASTTPGTGQKLFNILAASQIARGGWQSQVLSVYSDTGIVDVQGPKLRCNGAVLVVQDTDTAATGNISSIQMSSASLAPQAVWYRYTGSGATFYAGRVWGNVHNFQIDVSDSNAVGSEQWQTVFAAEGWNGNSPLIGFYGATPVTRPNAAGTATGYTAGTTAATFHSDDKYSGGTGTAAYTINGIVAALKGLGLIAT